jgi:processive 1,2-diacylglycerol beta-glucosyltransferase
VVTDFLPHSYWVLDSVDRYFVANRESKEKLHENGVVEEKIAVTGIPIDPAFEAPVTRHPKPPLVLVMGGSHGFGSLDRLAATLDKLPEPFEMVVIAGRNKKLYRKLEDQKKTLKKTVRTYPFVQSAREWMQGATLLITKPGGLTIAEALASRLPMVFINPVPGQESNNAALLLRYRVAVEAKSEEEAALLVGQLLRSPAKLEAMKKNMLSLAHPDAARRIAEATLHDLSHG